MEYEGSTRGITPTAAALESLGSISVSTSWIPEEKNLSPRETANPAQDVHPSQSSASSMYSVREKESGGDKNSIIKHLEEYLQVNTLTIAETCIGNFLYLCCSSVVKFAETACGGGLLVTMGDAASSRPIKQVDY